MKQSLSSNDKLVLKFIDKTPRDRNWINSLIFSSWSKKFKTKQKHPLLSKEDTEYSLRKLVRHGLIQTTKWELRHMRVYFKPTNIIRSNQE